MTVVVWVAPVPASVTEVDDCGLDEEERARVARFRRPGDGARFAAGRRLTRTALAHHTGVPADRLRFDRRCRWCGGPHGKPRLQHRHAPAPDFSLTTCDGLVAVAVAEEGAVGIDIEPLDRSASVDVDLMAHSVLSETERTALDALGDADARATRFLRLWTAKEAFAKAVGKGVALPLSGCSVRVTDDGALELAAVPLLFGPIWSWSLVGVEVEGFVGAVAVDRPGAEVELRFLDEALV